METKQTNVCGQILQKLIWPVLCMFNQKTIFSLKIYQFIRQANEGSELT